MNLTKFEKILISIWNDHKNEKVTAEQIVISSWKHFPEDFGLTGYKDKLIRSTIEKIDADVTTVKEDVNEIKESLAKMDERLYEMSRKK